MDSGCNYSDDSDDSDGSLDSYRRAMQRAKPIKTGIGMPFHSIRPLIVGNTLGPRASGSSSSSFDPLGRPRVPEGPALLLESKDMEMIDVESGCPVKDNWLVDDIGECSPGKKQKRRRDLSVERESRVLLGLSAATSPSVPARKARKRVRFPTDPVHRNTPSPSRKSEFNSQPSEVAGPSVVPQQIEIDDSDEDPDPPLWSPPGKRQKDAFTERESRPLGSSKSSTAAPICVRVRVENSTYFIPCPAKLETGGYKDTPISWLMTQASDRYLLQWEKRPLLRLTKMDGASLYPADAIVHVLRQDEEVIGVVKQWACEPLVDHYRKACRAAGQGTVEPQNKGNSHFVLS